MNADYWEIILRQISLLDKSEQEKFKNTTVTVIGCGGIGGETIEMLARLGVGKLILVDEDSYPVLDQILQTWQKELGVFIQIDVQSGENYSKRLKNGDFECAIMAVSSDSDTPSSVLNKFMKDSPFNYAKANIDGYSEILSSTVTQETVRSMANRYFEAERAVCYNGNFIPIYYQTEYFVWQKNVNNIIFDQGSKQCYYRYAYKY